MGRFTQVLDEKQLDSFLEECEGYQLSRGTGSPSDRMIAYEQLAKLAAYAIPELVQEIRDLRRLSTPSIGEAKTGLIPGSPAAERFIGDIAAKVVGRLRAKCDAELATNDAHWREVERNWTDWMNDGLAALATTPAPVPEQKAFKNCLSSDGPPKRGFEVEIWDGMQQRAFACLDQDDDTSFWVLSHDGSDADLDQYPYWRLASVLPPAPKEEAKKGGPTV